MSELKSNRPLPTPRALSAVRAALSLIAGVAAAAVFSYLLFRLGMPSQPFIYVSF
jgi:hypothetical protein